MQIILEVPDRLGEKLQRSGDLRELCISSYSLTSIFAMLNYAKQHLNRLEVTNDN